jgi:hypothetical protein
MPKRDITSRAILLKLAVARGVRVLDPTHSGQARSTKRGAGFEGTIEVLWVEARPHVHCTMKYFSSPECLS